MSRPLLRVEGVTAGYQPDLPIIFDISMEVRTGELVTIIGPNGAGKSTLIKVLAGLLSVSAGRVTLKEADITGLATEDMGQAGMAYVPQSDNIFATLTVDENLRMGALSLPAAARGDRIRSAFDRFPDLVRFRRRKAGVLSGGQRQMLAVARALLTGPDLILLDEPSAGLAPKMVQEVFAHLTELVNSGTTVLMVEQNARAAMAISDRTYVLAEGRNQLDGPSDALMLSPDVASIYLGRARGGH